MSAKCILFSNGNTAFFDNSGQVGELQRSWLMLYVDFLVSQNIDPLHVQFELPGGRLAKVFKTENGFYWQFI